MEVPPDRAAAVVRWKERTAAAAWEINIKMKMKMKLCMKALFALDKKRGNGRIL